MKKEEQKVHNAVVQYLKLQYPKVIFRSDGGGLRLPIGLAVQFKNQQMSRAYPDLFIAEPTQCEGAFLGGLYIEIKKDRNEYLTKKGEIRESEHIQEQYEMLQALEEKGYAAEFGGGIDECKQIIDDYLRV